jgi:hypothetical protein
MGNGLGHRHRKHEFIYLSAVCVVQGASHTRALGSQGIIGWLSHLVSSLSVHIYKDGHSVFCRSPHACSVPLCCPSAALYLEPPHPASIMAAVNVSSLPLDYVQANQGPKVDVISITAFTLATVAVVFRFLTRILKASLWWDDWAVLAALVSYAALA